MQFPPFLSVQFMELFCTCKVLACCYFSCGGGLFVSSCLPSAGDSLLPLGLLCAWHCFMESTCSVQEESGFHEQHFSRISDSTAHCKYNSQVRALLKVLHWEKGFNTGVRQGKENDSSSFTCLSVSKCVGDINTNTEGEEELWLSAPMAWHFQEQ